MVCKNSKSYLTKKYSHRQIFHHCWHQFPSSLAVNLALGCERNSWSTFLCSFISLILWCVWWWWHHVSWLRRQCRMEWDTWIYLCPVMARPVLGSLILQCTGASTGLEGGDGKGSANFGLVNDLMSRVFMLMQFFSGNIAINRLFGPLPWKGCVPRHSTFNDLKFPSIVINNSCGS